MKSRFPSLNALRTFDAVATHLSFTRAAESLHVTPGAVRQLINELEAELGVKLLNREGRRLTLTSTAELGIPLLRSGFSDLAAAVNRMTDTQTKSVLTVRVAPSFAISWLIPRLDRLRKIAPDLDVRLSASQELPDFSRDNVDILLSHDDWDHAELHSDLLFRDRVFPVCSPALLEGAHPLREPQDLHKHTLIHLDRPATVPPWPDWGTWLRAANVDNVDITLGPRFSIQALAHQAAANGQGVALGTVLAADELTSGALVRPFDLEVPGGSGFRLFCRTASLDQTGVAAFRHWLLSETATAFDIDADANI